MQPSTQLHPITATAVALRDDKRFEIVDGEWREIDMAGKLHGAIEANLVMLIGSFVKTNKLGRVYTGDTTYILDGTPDDIRVMRLPDVSFVATERIDNTDPHGYHYLAPDLAVEIVSPSERISDVRAKLNDYLDAGTRQVWLVFPDTQQVTVHHPNGTSVTYNKDKSISGENVLPNFTLNVGEVFE
jgi:Uma2 family endonuclease